MKWVTRDHVHMDRVACPWLIRRYVDPAAEFVFIPFGKDVALPEDAIPFGLPGLAELGAHDATGSTFRKILVKYRIATRPLEMLADIIESGIKHVFSQLDHGYTDLAALKQPEGVGLDAFSLGMMYVAASDNDDIERSLVMYDALLSYCRVRIVEADNPDIHKIPYPERWDATRRALESAKD